MKLVILAFFTLTSVFAATHKEMVSIVVKVKSHHGSDETMNLKIAKMGKSIKLTVDDFVLPETRILTNRDDIDTIVNFSDTSKDVPCGKDSFTYLKKSDGKTTQYSGCPMSKNFQALRRSFQNISALK